MSDAVARRHHRLIRAVVVGALLLGAGCGDESPDDGATPSTSSAPPTRTATATEPLEEVLRWLESPTVECPPSGFVLVQSSEDPMVALLQALGLESNAWPACPPAQEGH